MFTPMMDAADWDRILVADFSAERARLGETNVMCLGRRPAAGHTWLRRNELAVLLVTRQMVFAARRGPRVLPGPERMIVVAVPSAGDATRGLPLRSQAFSAIAASSCPSAAADAPSIVASLLRKPASTRSASAEIKVFLAARFLWTQSAASSADWSWPRSTSSRSRNAADCSGPRMIRGRRTAFSLRRKATGADGLSSGARAG